MALQAHLFCGRELCGARKRWSTGAVMRRRVVVAGVFHPQAARRAHEACHFRGGQKEGQREAERVEGGGGKKVREG